jgi:hypothetical protein
MNARKVKSKKFRKKEARQKVYDKLVTALAEFKSGVKDKKFEKKLRKTSKLFAVDIIESAKDKLRTTKLAKKKTEPALDEQIPKSA